jgi:hypothetical protein
MNQPNRLFGQNTKRLKVEADGTVHTAAGFLKPVTAFLQTAVAAGRTSCGLHLSQATLARPLRSDITSWRHLDAHTCTKQMQQFIRVVWRERVRILAGLVIYLRHSRLWLPIDTVKWYRARISLWPRFREFPQSLQTCLYSTSSFHTVPIPFSTLQILGYSLSCCTATNKVNSRPWPVLFLSLSHSCTPRQCAVLAIRLHIWQAIGCPNISFRDRPHSVQPNPSSTSSSHLILRNTCSFGKFTKN